MRKPRKPTTILLADDDAEIRMLLEEALAECRIANDFHYVENGEELMDYLYRRGKYTPPELAPSPGLILLDLNMPKKNGREVLKEIKTDPKLQHIAVVILTTSRAEEDVYHTYALGANSFIIKPKTFDRLIHIMKNLVQYWFDIVELPAERSPN